MANVIKAILCTISGGVVYWLGGIDTIIVCLLTMIVLDYSTGVIQAIISKTLSSEIGFKGIAKKVVMLLIVALAFVIETATQGAFAIREIVIMFFIANEAISLLENAEKLGVPIPAKLTSILKQIKSTGEENDA